MVFIAHKPSTAMQSTHWHTQHFCPSHAGYYVKTTKQPHN